MNNFLIFQCKETVCCDYQSVHLPEGYYHSLSLQRKLFIFSPSPPKQLSRIRENFKGSNTLGPFKFVFVRLIRSGADPGRGDEGHKRYASLRKSSSLKAPHALKN